MEIKYVVVSREVKTGVKVELRDTDTGQKRAIYVPEGDALAKLDVGSLLVLTATGEHFLGPPDQGQK